jgi:transcriptional regulator with XRE-family HTH domain
MNDFRAALRAARMAARLTQAAAAELLDASLSTYSGWEIGAYTPPVYARDAIIEKLRQAATDDVPAEISTCVSAYAEHKNIKATAKNLGWSHVKTRRILINEGIITTPRAEKIRALHSEGLSASEIAAALGVTRQAVNTYVPYVRASEMPK